MKKSLWLFAAFIAAFSMAFFACGGKSSGGDDDGVTVSLDKVNLDLPAGETATLVATVTGAEDTSVTWSTSNDEAATVANGVLTGVARGKATITATSVADPGKSATCEVTVGVKVTSVTIAPSSVKLEVGGTENLTVTVVPAEALDDYDIVWLSGNPSAVEVTVDTGDKTKAVVKGLKLGNSTITASIGGATGNCGVQVPFPDPVTGQAGYTVKPYELAWGWTPWNKTDNPDSSGMIQLDVSKTPSGNNESDVQNCWRFTEDSIMYLEGCAAGSFLYFKLLLKEPNNAETGYKMSFGSPGWGLICDGVPMRLEDFYDAEDLGAGKIAWIGIMVDDVLRYCVDVSGWAKGCMIVSDDSECIDWDPEDTSSPVDKAPALFKTGGSEVYLWEK